MEEDWEAVPGEARDEKRKRGRPRKENGKTHYHSLRLTEEEEKMLNHYILGDDNSYENASDVLRRGLRLMYFRDKYNI